MASIIDSAISWAVSIANDDSHKYSQQTRWGPHYDCSSLSISAYQQAGLKLKEAGASYTGNMKSAFLKCGFTDVTSQCNLSTGAGMKKGDVLLNIVHHAALVQIDGGTTVEARSTASGIVANQKYRNYPWNCVLRYTAGGESSSSSSSSSSTEQKEHTLVDKLGTGAILNEKHTGTEQPYKFMINGVDYTDRTGGISWSNSIEENSSTLSFSVAKNDVMPMLGSIVSLCTNGEIFRGIIITMDDADLYRNSYTCADFGWYLGKNKETYQFNGTNVGEAIKKILNDANFPIAEIPTFTETVKAIYVDKTLAEIINDMLDSLTKSYIVDMVPSGLRIYEYGKYIAYPEFSVSPNTGRIYSPKMMSGLSHSISIEELKNSIKVYTDVDDTYEVRAKAENTDSIGYYGRLQEIVKLDVEKDQDQTLGSEADAMAQEYAKYELERLNKPKESLSCTIIEAMDSYTRAGQIVYIEDDPYIINSSQHTIDKGVHTTQLDLEYWNGSKVKTKEWKLTLSTSSGSSSSGSTASAGSGCFTVSDKYNLSASDIEWVATCITGEGGSSNLASCRELASHAANLHEVQYGRNTTSSIKNTVKKASNGGWYANASWTRGCTEQAKQAVREVFNEGKRYLPRYVTEFDTFSMDIKNPKSKSAYKKGDTVNNKYGSSYKFYKFFVDGDIAGYFSKHYDKYKDDEKYFS